MILIVCVDDNYGMAFLKKRQSRDRRQRDHLCRLLKGKTLWVSPYSAGLFDTIAEELTLKIAADAPAKVKAGEYFFSELDDLSRIAPEAEEIWVYHWNRSYPDTLLFPEEALKKRTLIEQKEFAGSSHDRITFEVYR